MSKTETQTHHRTCERKYVSWKNELNISWFKKGGLDRWEKAEPYIKRALWKLYGY
jgi:hypothetical protein